MFTNCSEKHCRIALELLGLQVGLLQGCKGCFHKSQREALPHCPGAPGPPGTGILRCSEGSMSHEAGSMWYKMYAKNESYYAAGESATGVRELFHTTADPAAQTSCVSPASTTCKCASKCLRQGSCIAHEVPTCIGLLRGRDWGRCDGRRGQARAERFCHRTGSNRCGACASASQYHAPLFTKRHLQ